MSRHEDEFKRFWRNRQVGMTPAPTKLPADLYPRQLRPRQIMPGRDGGYGRDEMVAMILENSNILVSTVALERGFNSRQIAVGTNPVQVVDGRFLRGYIFLNPTPSTGLTTTGTLKSSGTHASGASGNTQATPLGVANYRNVTIFVRITAGTGTVAIDTQSQDPIGGDWATVTPNFMVVSGVGTYHGFVGNLGVDTDFAVAWSVTGGAGTTFEINFVAKDGLPGSGAGVANTIFLGGENVNSTNGYPLREGDKLEKFFRPNATLYAVTAGPTLTLMVFDLQ